MTRSDKPAKSCRQLAAEVVTENDPQRLRELTDELLRAMEEEKRQADARLPPSAKPRAKLRSAVRH